MSLSHAKHYAHRARSITAWSRQSSELTAAASSLILATGIMVTFGATRASDTCAADALAATEELVEALGRGAQRRLAENLPGPEAGIGAASGTVIYGAIGTEGRLEYAVIGNLFRAAKLQALTKTMGARALVTGFSWTMAIEEGF